jgi:YesN/AraC family two-component response regulator
MNILLNILRVDDEKIVIDGMLSGVRWGECGIGKVFTALSVAGAKEILASERVDILLCDIEMPQASGFDLLRHVRGSMANIACAFLTCHADFSYAKEAIRLGCADYLLKPCAYGEIEALTKRMAAEALSKKRARESAELGEQWLAGQEEKGKALFGGKKDKEQLADDIKKYVSEHLADDISVLKIASVFHMNQDYMNRVFKSATDSTISQHVASTRMKLAARLLESGRLAANAVASVCGYDNYPNFVSMFKKHYGMSPTKYQKMGAGMADAEREGVLRP